MNLYADAIPTYSWQPPTIYWTSNDHMNGWKVVVEDALGYAIGITLLNDLLINDKPGDLEIYVVLRLYSDA